MRLFNLKSVVAFLFCTLMFLAFTSLPVSAQDVSGMTGTVTDQSGAAIPGATVELTNVATGAKYTQQTNSIGTYRFAQVPPGQGYSARITAKGFASVTVNSITLLVGQVRTQNVALSVGAQVSTVEVTAANTVVTLDTSDALVGNNLDPQQLNNLPVQQRNDPLALFAMQPGVTDSGSVTGARVDQNNVTVDGLDVNDFATGGATQGNAGSGISSQLGTIVGHAPIDSVQEFQGNVAGNQASTGPAAGGQFALVTKSGTNHFHGDLNEYHRDTSLTANSWFSNDATPIVPRQHLIHNQFGGSIGGPILRNKAFFFFDFNDSKIVAGSVETRTVPSPALRAGSIVYCTASPCATNNKTLTMSQVSAYDPAGLGVDQTWLSFIAKRFPLPNQSSGGDGLNSLGYIFNAPNNDNQTNYVSRIDYRINPNQNLWGRFTITREDSVYQPNQFPGDPVTSPFTDRSYAIVIGHDWVIGQNKTNRVFLGETVQKVGFPIDFNPGGSTAYTFGDGADRALTSNPYIWPSAQARRVPNQQLGDDFSWIKGRHTFQFGGVLKDILAHSTNVTDYNITEVGLGGHVFSLSSDLEPSDLDTSSSASQFTWDEPFAFLLGRIGNVTSTYNYDTQGAALKQLTGDQRFYRYYQTQFYAQDTWKVFPSLSVTYGLTYQWFSVPYETRGLETVEPVTFDQFFGARVQQSATGATTVPLISYLLGGKANGPGAPGLYNPEYRNFAPHLGFAWNPGFDKKLVINGSAGIVYDRTVINAIQYIQDGYSYLFQQQKQNNFGTSGDPYNSIKNDARLDQNNQLSNVSLTPPATPKAPYQPFTGSQCAGEKYSPCGLQIGVFNSTIDPSLKTPYNMVFNFGVQRQLPWNMIVKANYVGRLGRKLVAQEDASQVLDFVDPTSGQRMESAFAAITQQTRQGVKPADLTVQPWFEDMVTPGYGATKTCANKIQCKSNTEYLAYGLSSFVVNGDFGDFIWAISPHTPPNVGEAAQFANNDFYTNAGFSTYHGLLLTLQKNMSNGIHYDFNYTWSHSIDNTSFFANSMGDTGIGGIGLVCDAVHPRECRSSSDFDARHYITADALYQMPFGKGRMYLSNASRLVDELIGGWDLGGLGSWHTGVPWSATSNAFVASFSNNAPPIFVGSDRKSIEPHLTKQADGTLSMFKDPEKASEQFVGPVGLQIGPRNSFRGPGFFNMDLGLAKNFPVYKESVNLKFRADAFNALNHPSFEGPAENVYNGYDAQDYQQGALFGQINFTEVPSGNENDGARVLQLSLRLEF